MRNIANRRREATTDPVGRSRSASSLAEAARHRAGRRVRSYRARALVELRVAVHHEVVASEVLLLARRVLGLAGRAGLSSAEVSASTAAATERVGLASPHVPKLNPLL